MASTWSRGCWSAVETRAWPSRYPMGVTVSQPADTSDCATLISDMSLGHMVEGPKRGSAGCRRRTGFGQLTSDSTGSLGRPK